MTKVRIMTMALVAPQLVMIDTAMFGRSSIGEFGVAQHVVSPRSSDQPWRIVVCGHGTVVCAVGCTCFRSGSCIVGVTSHPELHGRQHPHPLLGCDSIPGSRLSMMRF